MMDSRYISSRNRHGASGVCDYSSGFVPPPRRVCANSDSERTGEQGSGHGDRLLNCMILQALTAATVLAVLAGVRFTAPDFYDQIKGGVNSSFVVALDMEQINDAVFDFVKGTQVFQTMFGADGESPDAVPAQSTGESDDISDSASEQSGEDSAADYDDSGDVDEDPLSGAGDGDIFLSIAQADDSADGRLANIGGQTFMLGNAGLPAEPEGTPQLPASPVNPVDGGCVTSCFGMREDPFTGEESFHEGVDIAVGRGTPVYAVLDGVVIQTGYDDISGKYVVIEHKNGFESIYCHLSRITVFKGRHLSAGDRLGLSGASGQTTGEHLHFGLQKDGVYLDPLLYLDV